MSEAQCVDFLGNPLRVGDRVALGGRKGNCGALIVGTLVALKPCRYFGTVAEIRTDGKRNTARGTSSVVRVLTPEFAQQAAKDAKDAEWLGYLEAAGLDNWEGCSEARRMQREDEGGADAPETS